MDEKLAVIDVSGQQGSRPRGAAGKYPPNRSLLPAPRPMTHFPFSSSDSSPVTHRHTHWLLLFGKGWISARNSTWMNDAHSLEDQCDHATVDTQRLPDLPLLSDESVEPEERCLLVFTYARYANWEHRRQPIGWWLTARKKEKNFIGGAKK